MPTLEQLFPSPAYFLLGNKGVEMEALNRKEMWGQASGSLQPEPRLEAAGTWRDPRG